MADILEIVEEKLNLAKHSNNKEQKDYLLLESYAIILGYISAQNDTYFCNYRTDLKAVELENKINKILKVNFEIIGIKFSSLESFLFYISNVEKIVDIKMSNALRENFNKGYEFYRNWYDNRKIIDDILGIEKKYTFRLRNLI